ncbi:MAG: CDP-alcohol phosphatidyltransferase family protein [Blastochloris sp.]|nr:CDP-alcohol phosphatidyltransferase family protein [Blastochloris sp.]
MTFATQITLFRILLIPVFIGCLLYYNESSKAGEVVDAYRLAAVIVFLVASISDAIDGYVARSFKQKSQLGAVLDPLADKALLLSAIITLSFVEVEGLGKLPLWFLILVLSRDVILIGGFICLHLFTRHATVRPHWSGKASTFLQMTAVSIILLKLKSLPLDWVVAAAAFCTVISLVTYVVQGIRSSQESGCAQT